MLNCITRHNKGRR